MDGYTTAAVANKLYNKLYKESEMSDPIIHRYISIPKQVQAFRFQTVDYLGPLQIGRPSIWFMFDNHTFREVKSRTETDLFMDIRDLFDQDVYGCIFIKYNNQCIDEFDFHADIEVNGWVVKDEEIQDWVTKYLEYPTRYYISISNEGKETREYVNIGDWVITHQNDKIEIMNDDDFNAKYREYKGHA